MILYHGTNQDFDAIDFSKCHRGKDFGCGFYLSENRHQATITLNPVKGLQQKNEEKLRSRLAEIKAGLSADEISAVIESTKALKAYQGEPSRKEVRQD